MQKEEKTLIHFGRASGWSEHQALGPPGSLNVGGRGSKLILIPSRAYLPHIGQETAL